MQRSKDINKLIETFRSEYSQKGEPIRINFREIVPELNSTERYSHLIHSYPAKLLCHIPYFFLQTEYFCPKDGVVLDPFCGTGTVLLEANISGRTALGADANPLAVLISQVKTTYINKEILQKTLNTIISRAKRPGEQHYYGADHIARWFSESTIQQLGNLEKAINSITNPEQQRFFAMCLSNLVKKVSFADPSISVPVKLNPERFADNSKRKNDIIFKLKTLEDIDVYDKYESICQININRIESLKTIYHDNIHSAIISDDARTLSTKIGSKVKIEDERIDLILTSPPYAGAQKYIRSSWLNLFWLGNKKSCDIQKLNQQNIGREDYHKNERYRVQTGIKAADHILDSLYNDDKQERAFIVGNYLNEMKEALDESIRVLKKGGHMIIVIGNNTVCGRPFDTQDYLTTYLLSKGLNLQFKLIDDIKSYGLMTKRNKTASRISCEWVLVFKK